MGRKNVLLVTGGGGFLGSHLVPLLCRESPESEVVVITRNWKKARAPFLNGVEVIEGDLSEKKVWKRLPTGVTHLFHLAAAVPRKPHGKNQTSVLQDNLFPIVQLVDRARHWRRLKQVIFSSSISVYGASPRRLNEDSPKHPKDFYGMSKLLGESLVQSLRSRGTRIVCLRYSSLYGLGQYLGTVLPTMIHDATEKNRISVFGSGRRTQDFLFCEDAARANLLAYQREANGVFNIGSGVATTMSTLARIISRVFSGGEAKICHGRKKIDRDPGNKISIEKAKIHLEFHPQVTLEQGLRKLRTEMAQVSS